MSKPPQILADQFVPQRVGRIREREPCRPIPVQDHQSLSCRIPSQVRGLAVPFCGEVVGVQRGEQPGILKPRPQDQILRYLATCPCRVPRHLPFVGDELHDDHGCTGGIGRFASVRPRHVDPRFGPGQRLQHGKLSPELLQQVRCGPLVSDLDSNGS